MPLALLLGYCAALLRWPHAWLFLLPALLPVIDRAPLTGAIYLTESDLLVLATLSMGYGGLVRAAPNLRAERSAGDGVSPLVLGLI